MSKSKKILKVVIQMFKQSLTELKKIGDDATKKNKKFCIGKIIRSKISQLKEKNRVFFRQSQESGIKTAIV